MKAVKNIILLILITILTACAFRQDVSNNVGDEFSSAVDNIPREVPIVIYIDKDFPKTHKDIIVKAFTDWTKTSSSKIRFILIWDEPKPGPYKTHRIKRDKIFLWWLNKTSVELSQNKLQEWKSYSGVWVKGEDGKSGNIIVFSYVSEKFFYATLVHEVGHMLGLEHTNKHKTIMNHSIASRCITQIDAEQLCDLYNCKPQAQCK